MKKFLILLLCTISFAANAKDEEPISYIEEMKALGTVSGNGLACGASKYETFEMLARALLITKAVSDENQEEGMRAYNTAKADAFLAKISDGMYNCSEINARFNNQKIFKATLYADGTIEMHDSTRFYPRHPYDATLLKDDEKSNREQALKIYNEARQRSKGRKKYAITADGKPILPENTSNLRHISNKK